MKSKSITPGRFEEFKRQHPDFWDKLEKDKALKPGLRKKFKRYIESHKRGNLKEFAELFFRRNKLKGPIIYLKTDEALGSVRSKTALVAKLMKSTRVSRSKVLGYLADWATLGVDELQSEIENILGDTTFGEHLMWSYRNARNPYDPFHDVVLRDLPCRLGLPSYGEDHYAFGHLLPSGKHVRQPTAFDGELYEQWVPGGLTLPHRDCNKKYSIGLPEVVHRPNSFKNICTKLKEIKNDIAIKP